MTKQIYIWKEEQHFPVHRSIELPLGSAMPKFITVLNKLFQFSGCLLKGLHLYVEIESEM